MRISFSPQRRDDTITATRQGDILTINGAAFDFSSLNEGDLIPAGAIPCEWIVGPVERKDGQIHLTLILPHGPNPTEAVAFPQPIVNPPDGPIALPTQEVSDNVEP